MRALVLEGVNKLVLRDMPKPVPTGEELLVKTVAATICTSDIIDILQDPFHMQMPRIMGHEGAGIVEAVGELVTDFKPGDEIAAHPIVPCRVCHTCRSGFGHLCDNMTHLGIHIPGVYAEYFTIRQDRARRKPPQLPFSQAALLEPVAVCLEAIKQGAVEPGQTVLVVGDGPFGVITARLCAAIAGVKVIFAGHHDVRMAGAPGAIPVNTRQTEDPVSAIRALTGGIGADCAILCVGSNAAVDLAIASLRTRGTLSVFSLVHGRPTIDLCRIHLKELTVRGSCSDHNRMDESIALLGTGVMNGIVSHEFPLEAFEAAFDTAINNKAEAFKVALLPC